MSSKPVRAGEIDAPDRMVGDINFFLYPYDEDHDDDGSPAVTIKGAKPQLYIGEVDIMIASSQHRSRGLGQAAVTALLLYIDRNLPAILSECAGSAGPDAGAEADRAPSLKGVVAKIKASNVRSAALFARLGFVAHGGVNYFGERELRLADLAGTAEAWTAAAADWSLGEGRYAEVPYVRE